MAVLQIICNQRGPGATPNPKGDLLNYTENTVAVLMEKIGETNTRIQKGSEDALFACGQCPAITNAQVVSALAKGTGLKQKF